MHNEALAVVAVRVCHKDRSGLLTRIATMESVSLCERMKS
jgi:hypothetical protein